MDQNVVFLHNHNLTRLEKGTVYITDLSKMLTQYDYIAVVEGEDQLPPGAVTQGSLSDIPKQLFNTQ